jgi:hypothetical protein
VNSVRWFFTHGQCFLNFCHYQTVVSITICVRFEVFTAVTMKKAVFWDVVPCRNSVNRRFGGTYSLHLQGRRKKKIRKRRTSLLTCSRWFFARGFSSTFKMEAIRSPKSRLTQYLHGATSQKTAFFSITICCPERSDIKYT